MQLTSSSFTDGAPVPGENAFCIPDLDNHVTFGGNRNPHLAWASLPAETLSLALICHDPDAPTSAEDVNFPDREVPHDLPRADFFHWVAVNLPSDLDEIAEGSFSDGVVAHGRDAASAPFGSLVGRNDYTGWFAGDTDMQGDYYGYDGPCPPWNDSLVHHYVFTLYALDVHAIDMPNGFEGRDLREAIEGHVVEQAKLTGTYTLNPRFL